ncbi:hypothetical protein ACO2Q8_24545 [Larkinella sp. VNQ87]|uniref:hypothetical protein n=1 Tax=Larkinella sp. VNQ87 TaxID=3400921 RepID=UPI003C06310D
MKTLNRIPQSDTRMNTFADRAMAYYNHLTEPEHLPTGVSVLNPYQQSECQ